MEDIKEYGEDGKLGNSDQGKYGQNLEVDSGSQFNHGSFENLVWEDVYNVNVTGMKIYHWFSDRGKGFPERRGELADYVCR